MGLTPRMCSGSRWPRFLFSDPAVLIKTVIAYDAVVVVLHPDNNVGSLTTERVKKIFTGEIVNWKDVGGADAPIIVNPRTAPSGTLDFFIESFLGEGKIVATAKQHASNGLVRQAVAANKNAIGFISLGYLDNSVKAPTLDGVAPSLDTAKAGTYKHVRPFIMVTKGAPSGLAKAFLDFAVSKQGREMVGREYITVK